MPRLAPPKPYARIEKTVVVATLRAPHVAEIGPQIVLTESTRWPTKSRTRSLSRRSRKTVRSAVRGELERDPRVVWPDLRDAHDEGEVRDRGVDVDVDRHQDPTLIPTRDVAVVDVVESVQNDCAAREVGARRLEAPIPAARVAVLDVVPAFAVGLLVGRVYDEQRGEVPSRCGRGVQHGGCCFAGRRQIDNTNPAGRIQRLRCIQVDVRLRRRRTHPVPRRVTGPTDDRRRVERERRAAAVLRTGRIEPAPAEGCR